MAAEALRVLAEMFGHSSFRAGQAEIVGAIMAGRDVLAVLPTGTGKSLCYQLPACLIDGLVVVVSPLIALMKDQVDRLARRGVTAVALHGGLSESCMEGGLAAIAAGRARIVYLAPERLAQPNLLDLLRRRGVGLLAVDEAHCITAWGHDFRPAYRHLGGVADCLSPAVRAAFTATATPDVAREIMASLGLRRPFIHVGGFFRGNLHVRVLPVRAEERLAAVRASLGDGAAIVYVATRAQAEAAGAKLGAPFYHAGLPHEQRARVQDDFVCGRTRVIVATNAFGLGVDKPDIRSVVHLQMPGSLEAYVQEMGRGGRDGLPSRCVMLHARGDEGVHRALVERACPDEVLTRRLLAEAERGHLRPSRLEDVPGVGPREAAGAARTLEALVLIGALRVGDFGRVRVVRENLDVLPHVRRHRLRRLQLLRRMSAFADMRRGCRHAALVAWFGQRLEGERCGACDLCGAA